MTAWIAAQGIMLLLSIPLAADFLKGGRENPAVGAYGFVIVFCFIMAVGQFLENSILMRWRDLDAYWVALRITYIGLCGAISSVIHLAWRYTGNYRRYKSPACLAALAVLSVFFYLSVLTNDAHHLFYYSLSMEHKHYGPIFYAYIAFAYSSLSYACVVMLRTNVYGGKRQAPYVLLGLGMPTLSNMLGIVLRDPVLEVTVPAFFAMLLCTRLYVFHQHPTNLAPVAAKEIFDTLRYPVLVLGPDGTRLYANAEADALAAMSVKGMVEGIWRSTSGRTYLPVRYSAEDGNIILTLDDITEQTFMLNALNEQQEALSIAQARLTAQNEQLRLQALTARDLAAEEQRARVMTEIDQEVRGKLEALTESIEGALARPDDVSIQRNVRLSLGTLETVRGVIAAYKRRAP